MKLNASRLTTGPWKVHGKPCVLAANESNVQTAVNSCSSKRSISTSNFYQLELDREKGTPGKIGRSRLDDGRTRGRTGWLLAFSLSSETCQQVIPLHRSSHYDLSAPRLLRLRPSELSRERGRDGRLCQ